MTYTIRYRSGVTDEIRKCLKNDPVRLGQLAKKIEFLTLHPDMGKPLRNVLKGCWRVHIGPYVLVYKIDQPHQCVVLIKFRHHDDVYS